MSQEADVHCLNASQHYSLCSLAAYCKSFYGVVAVEGSLAIARMSNVGLVVDYLHKLLSCNYANWRHLTSEKVSYLRLASD